jgi:hypothetical protein
LTNVYEAAFGSLYFCGSKGKLLGDDMSFLKGFGIGVGLGVLFAPARGEETRRDLGDPVKQIC